MKPTRILTLLSSVFVACGGHAATLYWDTNGPVPGSGDLGGTWETGAGNWNLQPDGTGEDTTFTAWDGVVFSAGEDSITEKTVTVQGTVSAASIALEDSAVVHLSGGTLRIDGGVLIDLAGLGTDSGRNPRWTSVFEGTGPLTLRAHGSTADAGGNSDLTLSGANTFTGEVTIPSGLVNLASSFGNPTNRIVLNGGGLSANTPNVTSAHALVVGAAGGVLRTAAGSTATLSGPVANATGVATASLRHTDAGTLRLTGGGAGFTGTLTNARGELQLGGTQADWGKTDIVLPSDGGNLTVNGTGITKVKSIATVADHTLVESGSTLDVAAYTITPTIGSGIAANIGAAGNLGRLTSSTGTLTIQNGRSDAGTLDTNGHVVYVTLTDPAPGTALTLAKTRNNDLRLAAANLHTGGTTIHAGRINGSDPGSFGTGKVVVNSGGQAFLSAGGVYPNDFELAGIGPAEATATRGALRFATATVGGSVTIASAGARITAASGTAGQITGALKGSGPLAINSADSNVSGTVSLAGSGTAYTGTVTVNQGRFNFASTLGGSVTVAPTVGDATLGGGTTLAGNLTLDSTTKPARFSNSNGTLAVAGNVILKGTNPVVLAKPAPGTSALTLLTYGGTLTGTAANLTLDNAASYRGTPSFDTATPGQIRITGLQGQSLTWSGATTAWNIETTPNWNNGTTTFSFGDAVTFTNTATNKSVVMAATLEPHSVTFSNSEGNDYTLSGTSTTVGGLAGSTGLTKTGTGMLTLAGNSSFTGPVSLQAGKLKLNSGAALGFTSGITIAAGAQLDINGQSPGATTSITTGGYHHRIAGDGDGSGAIINSGAALADARAGVRILTLNANASVGTNSRFDIGYDTKSGTGTVFGGGYVLTKKGTGEIRFRAPASFFRLAVESGRAVAQDTPAAFGGASGAVTVASGAELATAGNLTVPTPVTFTDAASLTNAGGGTGRWSGLLTTLGNLTVNTSGGDIALGGGLAGSGILTKSGAGTLLLDAAASPFTGRIHVTEGTLRATSDAALGAPPATLVKEAILLAGGTLQGGTSAGPASATLGHPNRGITVPAATQWSTPANTTLTLLSPVFAGGNTTVSTGSMTFAGGLDLAATYDLIVQDGGTATLGGAADPATLRVRTGTLEIANGAVVRVNRFVTADASGALSTVRLTGGSIEITGTDNSNTNTASLQIGHWGAEAAASNVEISGGLLHAPLVLMSFGWDSTNCTLTQTGGAVNVLGLNLNNTRNNPATYHLNGGRLNLGASGINPNAAKTVTLGGGTLGALADWTSTQPLTLTGNGGDAAVDTLDASDGTTPRTVALTGILSGSGGLVKRNAGTLSLHGAHTHTGTTTVEGGTLHLAGSLQGPARATTGGTFAAGAAATPGTATVPTLTLDGGAAGFRLARSGGDMLTVTADAGLTVATPSTIRTTPGGALAVNDVIPLLKYTGPIGGLGAAGLTLEMTNPHFAATLVNNTTTSTLEARITAAYPVLWKGSVNTTWDLKTTANWQIEGPGTPDVFHDHDHARFTDAGLAAPVIDLTGTIRPALAEFDSTGTYTLQGAGITGTGALLKKNTGTLVLANDNTHTGTTTILAGTLEVGTGGTSGSLGNATPITNQGTLAIRRSDAVTLSNTISGAGRIVNRGSGQLALTGNNSFTGEIVMESGTLVGNAVLNAFGTTAGGITIKAGAAYNINGQTTAAGERVTLEGSGPAGYALTGTGFLQGDLVLTGNAVIGDALAGSINIGMSNAPRTITGAFTLTKAGPSRLWYRGPENGAGNSLAAVVVEGGTFGIENGNNALNGVPITVHSGGILSSWANATASLPTTQNNPITLNGGTLGSDYDRDVWAGPVTLTADSNLSVDGSARDFIVSSAIGQSGGTFGLTKNTASTVTLAGANTYTGNTTLNAGTLVLADNASLTFALGANGVCNRLRGTGTATLQGDFVIERSGAAIRDGNSWQLVDAATLTESYAATFNIAGFTRAGTTHTLVEGNKTWTFSETTGLLSLAVTGGSPYDDWAATAFPAGTDPALTGPGADLDGDKVTNAMEFALNGSPASAADRGIQKVYTQGGVAVLTFPVRNSGGAPVFTGTTALTATTDGITYTIRGSLTLSDAFNQPVVEITPPVTTDLPALTGPWEYRSFRVNPATPQKKGFLRLTIETP